jgi:hypothetical protein
MMLCNILRRYATGIFDGLIVSQGGKDELSKKNLESL